MLIEEAKWLGKRLNRISPSDVFPLIDLGSSTERSRKISDPWVHEHIFAPARQRNGEIVHLDIKHGPGIDITGDLADQDFLKELSRMRFNSVLCTNLLEHLENRAEVCQTIVSMIPEGGYIFVSCPHSYPHHSDPIDTGFRPDLDELAALFPGTWRVDGEMVTCGTYFDYITRSPWTVLKTVIRIFTPFYHPRKWMTKMGYLPWLARNFQAACLVLRKGSPHVAETF